MNVVLLGTGGLVGTTCRRSDSNAPPSVIERIDHGLPPLTDEPAPHLLAEVWPVRDLPATTTKDAQQVTVIAAVAALAIATCIGYYFGRRAASTPPSWKKRTTRIALGRQAFNLLAMIAARRIKQRFEAERVISGMAARRGLRAIAPLGVRRGSVVRLRSY